eukprot:s293_g12.t1
MGPCEQRIPASFAWGPCTTPPCFCGDVQMCIGKNACVQVFADASCQTQEAKALQVTKKRSTSSSTKAEGFGPAERLEELWRAAASFQVSGECWPPSSLVACAKHLCGGATDIALRSLKAASKNNVEGLPVRRWVAKHPDGCCSNGHMVCVATCCHHRCDIHSYVNRPFLERLGLCHSAEDFAQFVSTAGWAVGGLNRSTDRARDLEKRKVGMMAKRILDLGRVAWLRQELQLPDATLMDYISKAVTPENMVIVAGAMAETTVRPGSCPWEVLEEILWANDEPPAVRSKSGCLHILKLEEAQAELQFWLRRMLRDRLDQQRKRILAQGQVGGWQVAGSGKSHGF